MKQGQPGSFTTRTTEHTSVLDTVLRQDTMAPVADAADSLHTTCSVRWTSVGYRVFLFFGEPLRRNAVESLLELSSHSVPLLTVRVADDRLVGEGVDVVRKGEPIVTSGGGIVSYRSVNTGR